MNLCSVLKTYILSSLNLVQQLSRQANVIHCRYIAFWCGKSTVQVLPDNPGRLITHQFVWVPRYLWGNPELPGYKAILPSGSAAQQRG